MFILANSTNKDKKGLSFTEISLKYLTAFDFVGFYNYALENINALSFDDLGSMHLCLCYLKMFYADETMFDELKATKKLLNDGKKEINIDCQYYFDQPSLFIFFNPEGGSLSKFRGALQRAELVLEKMSGDTPKNLAQLCQAEVYYYTGYVDKAILLAEPIYQHAARNSIYYPAIIAGTLLIRCYTSMGELIKLQNVMTQLIRYSKILSKPKFKELYTITKSWLNYTTGWMGEMPRFLTTPNGIESYVLEDRIYYHTEKRMFDYGEVEGALLKLARQNFPNGVAIKDIQSDLFRALTLFKYGQKDEAADIFYNCYCITQKNRVIMPFVEYGRQILPLLQYSLTRKGGEQFARRWSDKLNQMATQYEESLRIIRGESSKQAVLQAPLSDMEMNILSLIVKGLTTAETAQILGIPIEETKESIRGIYRKMDAHNRAEAVAKALGARIISLENNDE